MGQHSDTDLAEFAYNAGFADGGADNLAIAVAIALAESGGRDDATHDNPNGSTDYGLWQINSVHTDILGSGDWRDPQVNARMARVVYEQSGAKFTPWSTYNSGAYRLFLARGHAAAKVILDAAAGKGPTGQAKPIPGKTILDNIPDWLKGILDVGAIGGAPAAAGTAAATGVFGGLFGDFAAGLQELAWIAAGSIVLLLGIVIIVKQGGVDV